MKLQRVGAKNQPYYRVVVQDESATPSSNVIEVLGQYHPLKNPAFFEVNKEKTLDWIRKGAKPTEKLRILLGKAGILPPVDLAALPKRKPKGEQEKPAEAPAAEAAAAPEAKPASTEVPAGKEETK